MAAPGRFRQQRPRPPLWRPLLAPFQATFENGDLGGAGLPTLCTLAADTVNVRTGTYSLKATGTGSGNGVFAFARRPASAGCTYRCSAWFRLAAPSGPLLQLFLSMADPAGTLISQYGSNGFGTLDTWVQSPVLEGVAGANTATVEMALVIYAIANGTVINADDALIERVK